MGRRDKSEREPLAERNASPRGRRPRCSHCRRPLSVCYCAFLPQIETLSRVLILQHPLEEKKAIGTGRMAHLSLPGSSLHIGDAWDTSEVFQELLESPSSPPVLLFPGPGAKDILRAPPSPPVTLVVVDGTWPKARTTVRNNPRLAALPRYAFRAPTPSVYRIRREPAPHCMSTIEAIMIALGAIEGDPERFRPLLDPMHAMVEAQLAAKQAREQSEALALAGPGLDSSSKERR